MSGDQNRLAVVARELRAMDPRALAAVVTDMVEERDALVASLRELFDVCWTGDEPEGRDVLGEVKELLDRVEAS